jgi:hypothetical protein
MFRIAAFILFFSTFQAVERPFVTCRISGQLANNLNQIATTLAYAWDNNAEAFFPELNKTELNIAYNQRRIFFRLNNNKIPRPVKHVYNEYENGGGWWDCKGVPFKPDQYLSGDFFCWKHFHHHRSKFIDLFAPSQEVLNYLQKKYAGLLNDPKAVSIHVRTYNKAYHDSTMRFLGLEYYRKAIQYFPKDSIFVVFSDRINWCKKHFPSLGKQFVFIEGNDPVEDFQLMAMLPNHIISNSCFSWWAAYLCIHPDKIVIAPNRNGRYHTYINNHLYLKEWFLVNPNLDEPYPEDMKSYDEYSTSVDTQ